jgi:hypothetical protein
MQSSTVSVDPKSMSLVVTENTAIKTSPSKTREVQQWAESPQRESSEKNLWKWNVAMAILHGVQAIVVLALGLTNTRLKAFKIPFTTSFVSWTNGYPQPAVQVYSSMPFIPVTSGFAFMSSIAHIIVLIYWQRYLDDLRRGRNLFRWFEYAASSSLMIALIGQLFGIYDVVTLSMMIGCNASMNFFGLLHETMNEASKPDQVDWSAFWFGCFAGVAPWAAIFAAIGGLPETSRVPSFVWALLIVYLFFFNTFPINMYLQYKNIGWWSDSYWGWPGSGYYQGERVYQILSLVSKSLLLWLVVGGANQPNASTGTTANQ